MLTRAFIPKTLVKSILVFLVYFTKRQTHLRKFLFQTPSVLQFLFTLSLRRSPNLEISFRAKLCIILYYRYYLFQKLPFFPVIYSTFNHSFHHVRREPQLYGSEPVFTHFRPITDFRITNRHRIQMWTPMCEFTTHSCYSY